MILVLPPLTQLNTPYPSIAYLARFLRDHGVACEQRDLGIELVHSVFRNLEQLFDRLEERDLPEPAWRMLALREQHLQAAPAVLDFLGGRRPALAHRILAGWLPAGPRVQSAQLDGFGPLAVRDPARHLATQYLSDLADLVTSCEDEGFGLARYQHHLGLGQQSFDPLWERLQRSTWVDERLDALCDSLDTDLVGLSVPFPGNLYGALRLGRRLKARGVEVWMGGGYVNTELREVDEARLWECVDALTYDDGEGPLLALLEHRAGGPDRRHRTRTREGLHDHPFPRPPMTCGSLPGLRPELYLDLIDSPNPAHRLWSDGRWNKITVAHGCYWRRCAFCDVSLDYIARFEAAGVDRLIQVMREQIEATGETGFHLVDEAAPPAALRRLALAILESDLGPVQWWGNIRFERAFTPDLCRLLAESGCVAVTGGLEVASDRLLERMAKGVTVEQVARAAQAFRDAGVRVHAYLMYGFPTQTVQETVDSMELVRQLFAEGALDSAFWHRFVLTRHAPIALDPGAFGVEVLAERPDAFARNDLAHRDPQGADHDRFDRVLPRALKQWMLGQDLARDVPSWFDEPMPSPTEPPDRIRRALSHPERPLQGTLLWLGGEPLLDEEGLVLHGRKGTLVLPCGPDLAEDLADLLEAADGHGPTAQDAAELLEALPPEALGLLREAGLLGVG